MSIVLQGLAVCDHHSFHGGCTSAVAVRVEIKASIGHGGGIDIDLTEQGELPAGWIRLSASSGYGDYGLRCPEHAGNAR